MKRMELNNEELEMATGGVLTQEAKEYFVKSTFMNKNLTYKDQTTLQSWVQLMEKSKEVVDLETEKAVLKLFGYSFD